MTIRNISQNTVIAARVIKADTPHTRMQGLLGKDSLANEEALLIIPCQSVHMLFMKFSIDVIFVGKDNRVVGLCPSLRPFTFSPVFWKSSCAIELPVGTIDRTKTKRGDTIEIID